MSLLPRLHQLRHLTSVVMKIRVAEEVAEDGVVVEGGDTETAPHNAMFQHSKETPPK